MLHLGNNIKNLRQLKGKKQTDLAKILEVTQQYISKIENSKYVSSQIIKQIAAALHITEERIMNFDAEEIT